MKKILFIISMLFSFQAVHAQVSCNQGNQDPAHRDPNEVLGDSTDFAGQTSVDPNEIIGPQGYDTLQWVSINDVLNYTIYFENDPEFATANAQRVDVRFEFDKKELMKDFTLGGYGFANMSWEMEKPSNTYQNRLNLVDTMSIYVDLIAGLDVTKKQAFWKFSSIDPESGFAPWQHDRGMLPVNDSTHVGEGFVRFSIKPVSTMHTGDTISIQANIVFDQNDTIPTNRWKNVIDAGTPTSRVTATVDAANEHLYTLRFEAADDEKGSGVKQVYLYLANQFGTYEEYAVCAPDSILTIETEPGRRYEFYSLAEDNVGNREPLKEQSDVVLNNNVAPIDIALSATKFQDDIQPAGFIAEISSVDTEENGTFTYALAEGDGAIHNDLFQIEGTQLQAKQAFKCAEDNVYKIRLSTTDKGGLTFSKAFELSMENVLVKPKTDTLDVEVCNGETFLFHGVEYAETGLYHYSESNEYMCDSTFVINLTVRPLLNAPTVTIEGTYTLVSSSEHNNQWFREDGTPVEGATEQKFTPTEDGVYYVATFNGSCYSEPSTLYRVQLTDHAELAMNLVKGWNWISSNLAEEQQQNPITFLTPIREEADQLISQTQGLLKDEQIGWTGNLQRLAPQEAYKLHLTENLMNTWSGLAMTPETTPINLHRGWNWIGYVPTLNKEVNEALSGFTASDGDIIKSFDDFAIFYGGRWLGTLTTMKPGEGYLYQAKQDGTLTYSVTRVFVVDENSAVKRMEAEAAAPWTVVSHKYPDNMTLIADVYAGGTLAPEGLYTIGAFVNDECRGIGQYVGGKLFMTVHGDMAAGSIVGFKAIDNASGEELNVTERCDFANVMQGSMQAPYSLHVDAADRVESLQSSYNIYPNPVRDKMYVNGNTDDIEAITVISSTGQRVLRTKDYSVNGVDVSALANGAYVVVVTTSQGDATYKIIKNK